MSKHKLLLADDSVTIQKVVNLTFSDEGIEVITAGDGNTAMEKFVEFMPDLVMVDVNMPGFDGYRICEMIKQDEETRHIPVILLVGSFEPFDEAEARRVGADDYLTKPFQSIRQLVSRVSDLLNNSTVKSSSPSQKSFTPQNQETAVLAGGFKDESEITSATNYGVTNYEPFADANLDDGMIQTSQIGSLPADETQKFVSDSYSQTPENNSVYSVADESEALTETQPFNIEYFEPKNVNQAEPENFRLDEKIFEFADASPFMPGIEPNILAAKSRQPSNENEEMQSGANLNMTTKQENDINFDLDDLNFLELPPPVKKPKLKTQTPATIEELPEITDAKSADEKKDSPQLGEKRELIQTPQLSPEIIEAITKKIMEKLSDKISKEIARELTPQMTESIIEEMARNKTN